MFPLNDRLHNKHGLLFTVQIKKKVTQMSSHYNKHGNVLIIMTSLRAGGPRMLGLIPSGGKKFLFLQMPKLDLGGNQLSIQWVPRSLSPSPPPRLKQLSTKVTIHLHQDPRLRMHGAISPFLPML